MSITPVPLIFNM